MSSSEAGVFSQAELEIERDYRKQVRKLYYKRESDFTSLRAYNDYLEEFESLVEQLIDKGTREAGNARLAELRASDEAARLTAQNLMKFDAKLREMNERAAEELREQQRRAHERLEVEQAAEQEQLQLRNEQQDRVAAGQATASSAQAELAHRLREVKSAVATARPAAPAGDAYEYVPRHVEARPSLAQPLVPQLDVAPKQMLPSTVAPTEAYEDDPELMSAACRAGGHDRAAWARRYMAEAFSLDALRIRACPRNA